MSCYRNCSPCVGCMDGDVVSLAKRIKKIEEILGTDIPNAVNEKIAAMVESGQFAEIVGDNVPTWLNAYKMLMPNDVVEVGQITRPDGKTFQGMTTDGNWLYIALIDNDDSETTQIVRVNPLNLDDRDTFTVTGCYGHANSLAYRNGYLYATLCQDYPNGIHASQGPYVQRYVAKIDVETWSATFVNAPGFSESGVGIYNLQFAKAYNDKNVILTMPYVGHGIVNMLTDTGENGTFEPFASLNMGTPVGAYEGITQFDRYILAIDSHYNGGNEYAGWNTLRFFNTRGDNKQNLVMPSLIGNNGEPQGLAVIGNALYFNTPGGWIYKIENLRQYVDDYESIPFGEGYLGTSGHYVYINRTGGASDIKEEKYFRATHGSYSLTFPTEFVVDPFFHPWVERIVAGTLYTPMGQIAVTENPQTHSLTFNGTVRSASGEGVLSVTFARSTKSGLYEYYYYLSEIRLTIDYGGTITTYGRENEPPTETLDAICTAGWLAGRSYVRDLFSVNAISYSYTPFEA